MIENIGAYSQVDYDKGYKKGTEDFANWLITSKYVKPGYGAAYIIRDYNSHCNIFDKNEMRELEG